VDVGVSDSCLRNWMSAYFARQSVLPK